MTFEDGPYINEQGERFAFWHVEGRESIARVQDWLTLNWEFLSPRISQKVHNRFWIVYSDPDGEKAALLRLRWQVAKV